MNEERRKRLRAARDEIEAVKEEEQEAYDNLPESLQTGERGDAMENNISMLDEAIGSLNEIEGL